MRCLLTTPFTWLGMAVARLPQPALLAVGGALAWLLRPWLGERRRIAAINLALCFPDREASWREDLLAAQMRSSTIGLLELLRAWYAPAARVRTLGKVDGLDHLHTALARGQGVLLLTGHFPQTELAARLLVEAFGRPVRAVVRRHNSPCLEGWLERSRRRAFGPTLAKKDVRGLLRALQAGEPVVYSADQDFSYQNAFVPFFGVPASTLTTTPEVVRRTGVVALPFWCHRDTQGHYHVRIDAPWSGWPSSDPVADAAVYMQALEAEVRRYPEQYLWLHRRFKTRPPGEPTLY